MPQDFWRSGGRSHPRKGTSRTGARKRASAMGIVGEAISSAANAAMGGRQGYGHRSPAQKARKRSEGRPQRGAAVH